MKRILIFFVICLLGISNDLIAQACDGVNLNITTDVLDGQTDDQHAEVTLTATNTVESGGTAIYKAGTNIRFEAGFKVELGGELSASIEECTFLISGTFVTKWSVNANESITIPTFPGETYSYTVDWGDGSTDTTVYTGDASHTYTSTSTPTVTVTGIFPRIYFNNSGDKDKIIEIVDWGDIYWFSMLDAFEGCSNLNVVDLDPPNLDLVEKTNNMFNGCTNLNPISFNNWDVSNVEDMAWMFADAVNFNADITNWVVSNVTNMHGMFFNAQSFDQNIGNWNVGKVKYMNAMFCEATSFNRDLDNWEVGQVVTFGKMFNGATSFNGSLLWGNRTLGATIMSSMFGGATSFNKDISGWHVNNVTTMAAMFNGATAFNIDLSNWEVGQVTDMSNMFRDASSLNKPLTWGNKTQNVTTMAGMFKDASIFNGDIENWNTSSVTDMSQMFSGAVKFNQHLSWDSTTQNVTDMSYMFFRAYDFNQDISDWDVGNVTTMRMMFFRSGDFNQDLGDWEISNVTNMNDMLNYTAISTTNYENTLLGWSQLPVIQNGITLGAELLTYCSTTGRSALGLNNNWTFDGDIDICSRPLSTEDVTISGFNMYPNPVGDKLYMTGLSDLQSYQIQISDLSGRLVLSHKNQTEIDVSGLKSGVYFIQILGESKITKKFIKL